VSGSRPGEPVTETVVSLDPDLALDVAAFVAETCRDRT
jgi:hypothetical protein